MSAEVRQLKLDDAALTAVLDNLDSQDARQTAQGRARSKRFPYRMKTVRLEIRATRDLVDSYIVASRNIGRDGMAFLASHVLHNKTACRLHLITMQNSWQTVNANVVSCRYIEGTACVNEIEVRFESPIDPALFSVSAICARVLVADDSAMSRKLVSHILQPLNVEVVSVENGLQAVKEALSRPYDLILMDDDMPELDGLNAVKVLRKKGYVRPICALSSKTADADRDASLLAGCDEFLPKPPSREHLAALIQRIRPEPLVSCLLHEAGMGELIDVFVPELLSRSREMEKAYHDQDCQLLAKLARNLKSEAGGFGFDPITKAAGKLEEAVERGVRLTELRPLLSQLLRFCVAARPASCDLQPDMDAAPERREEASDAKPAVESEQPAPAS